MMKVYVHDEGRTFDLLDAPDEMLERLASGNAVFKDGILRGTPNTEIIYAAIATTILRERSNG